MITLTEYKNKYNPIDEHRQSAVNLWNKMLVTKPFDFDVYLPSKNRNLQRELIWNIEQKRELILSVFLGRYIPPAFILCTINEIWQVIDGKQRINTLMQFFNNGFSILIDNIEFSYKDLPNDFKLRLDMYPFSYIIVYETEKRIFDDIDKISWFNFLNFSGTQNVKTE